MSVHEPMTMATDYLLGIAAAWFGVLLWRASVRPWALAFLFTAAAAFFGGSFHGFAPVSWLWKATVFSVGLVSFFLLSGAVVASVTGQAQRVLMTLAVAKFMAYATWMITHDNFVNVIVDYGTTMLLVAALVIVAWRRRRAPSAPWILAGIALSIVAALVQVSGVRFHQHFNHNDLYHLIQIAALWLLYRGGRLLTSTATDQPMTQPT